MGTLLSTKWYKYVGRVKVKGNKIFQISRTKRQTSAVCVSTRVLIPGCVRAVKHQGGGVSDMPSGVECSASCQASWGSCADGGFSRVL